MTLYVYNEARREKGKEVRGKMGVSPQKRKRSRAFAQKIPLC
jgi:hypothetical protein